MFVFLHYVNNFNLLIWCVTTISLLRHVMLSGTRNGIHTTFTGPSLSWSYGRWIYNYLCNQCLLPLMLCVRISIRSRCTTLCDEVCQWLATGQWFSPGTLVSSTNKTDIWSKNDSFFYLSRTWEPWSKSTSKYNWLSKRWTFRPQDTHVVDDHENGHEQQSLDTKSFCTSLVNRDFRKQDWRIFVTVYKLIITWAYVFNTLISWIDFIWFDFWCLMPLSAIVQLYHGDQF